MTELESAAKPFKNEQIAFVVLNHFNLVPVVSTRLIRPRSAQEKYYRDTLELRQDLIPIFTGPPGRAILEFSSAEGAFDEPVILELHAGTLTEVEQRNGALARFIPASRINRVHFARHDLQAEFLASTYENADPSTLPVAVSPQLFEEAGESVEDLISRLSTVPLMEPDYLKRAAMATRLTGGLLAVASLELSEQREISNVMHTFRNGEAFASSTSIAISMILRAISGFAAGSSEERLLQVLVRALSTIPVGETPGPDRLLDRYQQEALVSGMETKIIGRVQKVLDTQDIRPGDDSRLPVSFGLLLHIMRKEVSRLSIGSKDLAPFFTSGHPDRETLIIARFLAGAWRARAQLDTMIRSPALDLLAAELECDAAANRLHPLLKFCTETDVRESFMPDNLPQVLEPASETVQMQFPVEDVAVKLALLDSQPSGHKTKQVSEAVTGIDPSFQVNSDQGRSHVALTTPMGVDLLDHGVMLCDLRGWHDLIFTRLEVTGPVPVQLIPGRGSILTLEIKGNVKITRGVSDFDELSLRVSSDPLTEFEVSRIQGTMQPAKVSRPRKNPAPKKPRNVKGEPDGLLPKPETSAADISE